MEFAELLDGYREANVIGTRGVGKIIESHILDSLSCLLSESTRKARCIVDVGSGGGLPGIPLKLVRRGVGVSLMEATGKKARFLGLACKELGIEDVDILCERVEVLGKSPGHRERYDVATVRALARLNVLAEYCLPLVKVGGHVVAMKGQIDSGELDLGRAAAQTLGGRVEEIIPVKMLDTFEQKQRHLVVFEKIARTPEQYPRRTGVPAKYPL